MTWLTRFLIRVLDKISGRLPARQSSHLKLGERGEVEAYFYLRSLGYRMVATNFRVPHNRGEIDLIGWDNDVLCFIEVKTRSDDSFAPPSTAVTAGKQQHIIAVAKRYLRRLPGGRPPSVRFDILSIVMPAQGKDRPKFSLQKGAFTWPTNRISRQYWREQDLHHGGHGGHGEKPFGFRGASGWRNPPK